MTPTEAREKRGWTFHRAAQHMRGVSEQQLRNIEGIGAARPTDPLDCKLRTILEILRVYWPDVQLNDLVGEDTLLRVTPSDTAARGKLRVYAASNFAEAAA